MNTRTRQPEASPGGPSREQRKAQTRAALLESALDLLEEQSFDRLSLREVARGAGVVPTAFYRHFENMEQLGLALIEESFRTLRAAIREVRLESAVPGRMIRRSVEVLVRHVHAHRGHFRFFARERQGAVAALRLAIRGQIRLFASELAVDLARLPGLASWSVEDLNMLARVIVNAMVSVTEEIVDAPADSPEAEREIIGDAEKQLRLILLGATQWRSRAPEGESR